ncbi:MAG: peptidase S10 [Saprospiraceae bacterium]|nr:peptidase S10 [Saprospiraceae bacterium]
MWSQAGNTAGKTSPLSITKHSILLKNGKTIQFTATAGYLHLKTEDGKDRAHMFFTAYTKDGETDIAKRPVTYTFNGGPGSASVWLHMGALGPKRILMADDGASLSPPYTIVDNEYTWLEFTDLVFIDPVMTGFSRPADSIDKKEFTGYKEDIESVGEFIQIYSTRYGRWGSPKYLAGESYGTTRAAGLSEHLQTRYGMYLNGILLISQITNFQTARFEIGNDLPYPLFLPTYTATAWFHKKLDKKFTDLNKLLEEVRYFALNDYTLALTLGDKISPTEKDRIAGKLAEYTGLSKEYIFRTNLRINIHRFTKELRRSEGLTVGRLDSRFMASDYNDAGESPEFDPSYNATIYGPYTTAMYEHLKKNLKIDIEIPYEILTGRVQPWNYNNVQNQYLNVSENLRKAMVKNPFMKVLVCNGYYDLATPFFASEYTMDHMFLPEKLKNNIKMTYYQAGHMMYIDNKSLIEFTDDVRTFYGR